MPSATILGYGRMGREHERAYREMGVEVRIKNHDPETWDLAIGHTDYLSICSPDPAHAEQVIAGLEAGQAVFCEKPLCLAQDDLGAISKLPGRLGINYPLRHCDTWEAYPDASAEVIIYHWGRGHKRQEGWRAQMLDYSPILAGGCHLVDNCLYEGGTMIPFAGYRPKPMIQICSFYGGAAVANMICDLESDDGDHYQRVGRATNSRPTDKTICLKRFIEGEDTRSICLEGMEICLEMDRLSQK